MFTVNENRMPYQNIPEDQLTHHQKEELKMRQGKLTDWEIK